jgi:hypothetical protein
MLGRVIDAHGRRPLFAVQHYAFEALSAMTCDQCHQAIAAHDLFSRPEINQRTQRFSRVYYCRRCVPFTEWEQE